jgi:predicted transcriptional regulator of viral defense system
MSTAMDRLLALANAQGAIRAADLNARGIPVRYLGRLCKRGLLTRIDRGLYEAAGRDATEQVTVAAAARRVPHGVICLLSALQYHGITTQQPARVWMAIGRNSRAPRVLRLPIRIVRFSGKALTEGIRTARIEGVIVRVYSPAKTVADCFKYRNRIGLDVAIEALREARRSQKASNDELWRFAKVCRVANVMRPYLETIG